MSGVTVLRCEACRKVGDICYALATPVRLLSCVRCSKDVSFIARKKDGSEERITFPQGRGMVRLRCEDCKNEGELTGSHGSIPTRVLSCFKCSDTMMFEARAANGEERYVCIPKNGGRMVTYPKSTFDVLKGVFGSPKN